MSKFNQIRTLLKSENSVQVNTYIEHCSNFKVSKNIEKKTAEQLANDFLKVKSWGLVFDGVNVVHGYRGIDCNYKAYKNRMLHVYPESKIDLFLVFKGDKFQVSKDSGKVNYTHNIANPFSQNDSDVVGGYCIIKNKRGEFLTILDKKQIDKHRQVARTKTIWDAWYQEMARKTIIKKAVSLHFDDVFNEMNEEDNKQNDLALLDSEEVKAKNKQDIIQQVKSDLAACVRIQDVLLYEQNNPELKRTRQTGTMINQAKERTVKALKDWIDDDKNVKDGKKLDAIFEKSFAEYRDAFSTVSEPPTWWVELRDAFDNRKQQLG